MTGNSPVFATNPSDFAEMIRLTLSRAFGRFRCPAKTLARAADVSVGAAKAWLEGRATPQAWHCGIANVGRNRGAGLMRRDIAYLTARRGSPQKETPAMGAGACKEG
jgi:hypothetical protein